MYWDCSFRPKGENVDVKTVGMDEGNGEYLSLTTFCESVFIEHTLCFSLLRSAAVFCGV